MAGKLAGPCHPTASPTHSSDQSRTGLARSHRCIGSERTFYLGGYGDSDTKMKTRHEAFPSAIGSLSKNQAHQRGIALLLVLWVITLLTIIALGMTSTQRTEIALAANQVLSATFRAQADAAIYVAALNLLTQPPPEATADRTAMENMGFWVPDGQPQLWRLGETAMEIRVINEASLIDLNQAEPGLLLALLKAVGIEEQESARILDAILDWRDPDNLHLANGAEDDDYAAAGLPYGAKDGPFDSV
ncbi:MAG: hypothetical protein EP309_04855, partial [Gammaproteobacteria bacterium]